MRDMTVKKDIYEKNGVARAYELKYSYIPEKDKDEEHCNADVIIKLRGFRIHLLRSKGTGKEEDKLTAVL